MLFMSKFVSWSWASSYDNLRADDSIPDEGDINLMQNGKKSAIGWFDTEWLGYPLYFILRENFSLKEEFFLQRSTNRKQMLMLVIGIMLILFWLRGVQIWRQRAYFEISKYDKFLHTSDEKLDRKSIY